MFITRSEYDVLKKPINQTFKSCKENSSATLYVRQRDVQSFITIEKKYAQVRCDLTGKIIKKRKWNEETKAAAVALLATHKTSKKGWYILMLVMAIPVSVLVYTIYDMVSSSNNYKDSYISKTYDEKNRLLLELEKGDYVKTYDFVYKIEAIDKNHITFLKGNKPVKNAFTPIDENQTFKGNPIKIKKANFYNQPMIDNNDRRSIICEILNK